MMTRAALRLDSRPSYNNDPPHLLVHTTIKGVIDSFASPIFHLSAIAFSLGYLLTPYRIWSLENEGPFECTKEFMTVLWLYF